MGRWLESENRAYNAYIYLSLSSRHSLNLPSSFTRLDMASLGMKSMVSEVTATLGQTDMGGDGYQSAGHVGFINLPGLEASMD